MAREYIRPDIVPKMLAELVPPATTRILINPTWDELVAELTSLQKRCRRNRLSIGALRHIYDASQQADFFCSVDSTSWDRPPASQYAYDYPTIQAGACKLGNGISGFVLKRELTPPGMPVVEPIYSIHPGSPDFDAQQWFENWSVVFWTRLTDDEMTELEQQAITYAVVRAERERAERHLRQIGRLEARAQQDARNEARRREAAEHAHRTLQVLFRGVEPVYATHLSEACTAIANTLVCDGRQGLRWNEFKQRWPSIAAKYQDDLIPCLDATSTLSLESLRAITGNKTFSLSFGVWNGAQRVFDAPQIVFRVDARELLNGPEQVPATPHIARTVLQALLSRNRHSSHPCNEWTVGWLRVHVDYLRELAFVDEIQSDTLEGLHDYIERDPIRDVLELEKRLRPWCLHGFASVQKWARAINFNIGMHSRRSRSCKSGMTQSERKWNTYYEPVIKHFGLREEAVAGYPAPIMVGRLASSSSGVTKSSEVSSWTSQPRRSEESTPDTELL